MHGPPCFSPTSHFLFLAAGPRYHIISSVHAEGLEKRKKDITTIPLFHLEDFPPRSVLQAYPQDGRAVGLPLCGVPPPGSS